MYILPKKLSMKDAELDAKFFSPLKQTNTLKDWNDVNLSSYAQLCCKQQKGLFAMPHQHYRIIPTGKNVHSEKASTIKINMICL